MFENFSSFLICFFIPCCVSLLLKFIAMPSAVKSNCRRRVSSKRFAHAQTYTYTQHMYYRTLSAYGHVDCLRICVSQIRKYMFCLSALAAECTRVCMCIWAENDMYTSRHSIENDRTVACNAAAYSGIQRQQTEENSNMYDFHASMIYIRICVRLLTDRRTLTMQPFTYVVMRHFQTAYHTHVSVCVCV